MSQTETEVVQEIRRLVREKKYGQVTVVVQDGNPQLMKTEISKKLN